MKACVIVEPNRIEVQEWPDPALPAGHVLVRVRAASICGTDLQQYKGEVVTPLPRIPGHDCSGQVELCGPGVEEFQPGDRVVVKPSFPCGQCPDCRRGDYAACPRKRLIGLHTQGCFCELLAVPASNLVPLPESISFEHAAILEPFTVALNTFQRVKIDVGDAVAVLGQGPIGLGQTRMASLAGAGQIVAVDVRDEPLAISRLYGATMTINAAREDPMARVLEATGGQGVDVAIECAASQRTIDLMLKLVRKEGKVVNVGYVPSGTVDVPTLSAKTLTLFGIGGNGGRGQYERAVELVRTGKIDIAPLITHRFPLAEAPHAFEVARSKEGGAIKVVLV